MENIQHQSVTALACSPNGFLMASGGVEGTIGISTSDGVPLYTYHGHEGSIRSIMFSPSGRMVASASADGTVQVWDVITGKTSVIYIGHGRSVGAVSWSPDGVYVASCDQHEVQVWASATGLLKWLRHGHAAYSSVSWSPDGRCIVASDFNGILTLWTSEGQKVCEYATSCRSVCGMDWSPCGQFLAIGSDGSKSASVLALVGDRLVEFALYGGLVGKTCHIAWSRDGRFIVLGGYESLSVWPISEQWGVRKIDSIRHLCMISGLTWSSNDIVFGDEFGRMFTWTPGSRAGNARKPVQRLLFALQKTASGEIRVHLMGQSPTWSMNCDEVAMRWLTANGAILLEASSRSRGDVVSGTYYVTSSLLTFPC